MRYAAKVDANQREIVRALEAAGRQVLLLHRVGQSCPDLCAIWPGGIVFMEVKAEKGRLSEGQEAFRASWRGPRGSCVVVRTAQEALAATGVAI